MNTTRARSFSLLLAGTFLELIVFPAAWADTVFVKADASGANDGSSWMDAYRRLQTALAAAAPGDELWVAAATYRPDAQTSPFELRSGVAVYGGFVGNETARDQRNFTLHVTTLSGVIDSPAGEHSFHVVRAADVSAAVLDGFVITEGLSGEPDRHGGGIFITGGSPTIANCTLHDNSAWPAEPGVGIQGGHGGGVYCINGGQVTFLNCRFEQNFAGTGSSPPEDLAGIGGFGGGVYATDSSMTFRSCTFTGNSSGAGGSTEYPGRVRWGGQGGGLYAQNGTIVLETCTFATNRTGLGGQRDPGGNSLWGESGHGAGLAAAGTTLVIRDCTFDTNTCGAGVGQGGWGGAMYLSSCPQVSITNSIFRMNAAGSGEDYPYSGGNGGAIVGTNTTNLALTNCRFLQNRAGSATAPFGTVGSLTAGSGGALYVLGSLTVSGCEFSSNGAGSAGAADYAFAGSGGGIYMGSGPISISQCRFIGNFIGSAFGLEEAHPGSGGAIRGGTMQIVNTLFAANGAAAFGGAISGGNVTLTNVTMVSNQSGTGGGLSIGSSAIAQLSNLIAWNNTDAGGAGESAQIAGFNANDQLNYSCIQSLTGSLGGAGNIGGDPLFVNAATRNYRLSAGSPCIDAGQNSAVPIGVAGDLAGELRFVDDPATADTGLGTPPIVDIGAYEFSSSPPCSADLDDDGQISLSDLALLLSCFGRAGVPCADLNADGLTGLSDLALLLSAFGQDCP